MDDLTQRFVTFDRVPVPDLWPEITRRAAASSRTTVSDATVTWGRQRVRPAPSLVRLAVMAALLLAALGAGAFVAGSIINQPAVVPPIPTSTAEAAMFPCIASPVLHPYGSLAMPVSVADRSGLVSTCQKVDGTEVGFTRIADSRVQLSWVIAGCDVAATVETSIESGRLSARVVQQRENVCAGGTTLVTIGLLLRSDIELAEEPTIEYIELPSATPPVTSSGMDCAEWQAAGARSAGGWPTGSRPNGEPAPGWIATWNTGRTPVLVFVDPVSGRTCEVMRFSEHGSASDPSDRGWITWSPDGNAVAFTVIDSERGIEDLFVLSRDGLEGPIGWSDVGMGLDEPVWAPDGRFVTVTMSSRSVEPIGEAAVLVSTEDGGRSRIELECGRACWGDVSYVSPDGRHIAVHVSGTEHTPVSSTRDSIRIWHSIVVAEVETKTVEQHLAVSESLLRGRELVGWAAPSELLLVEGDGLLVGVPLEDRPMNTVSYGRYDEHASPDIFPYLAPDRSRLLAIGDAAPGDLDVTDLTTGEQRTIAQLDRPTASIWWAPDSSLIGYLIDRQSADQGIWTIRPDGTGQRLLAPGSMVMPNNTWNVWQPVWTAD